MIRDVCKAAAEMLGLTDDAEALASSDETADKKYLRLYNLVVSEIAEEYRRGDYDGSPAAQTLDEEEAEFYGISPRVLAYGVAAEYAVTEGLDVAEMWDTRYKSAIALAPRPPLRIRARRFV